jgi:hypothetical protein
VAAQAGQPAISARDIIFTQNRAVTAGGPVTPAVSVRLNMSDITHCSERHLPVYA